MLFNNLIRPVKSRVSFPPCHLHRSSVRNIVKWKAKYARDREPILPSSLVPVSWVYSNLSRIKILDASWFMPNDSRNAKKEFELKHLPTSQFFDLDFISDHSTSLPHMLPSSQQFTTEMIKFGIKHDDPIIIYDSKGIFSSPRVWFTFKCFGVRDVGIMNGGLPMWENKLLPLESGPSKRKEMEQFIPKDFTSDLIVGYEEILTQAKLSATEQTFQLLDARSNGRFTGNDPEPRPGLSSGHIPHSISIPYTELIKKDENNLIVLKNEEELKKVFEDAGVDLSDSNSRIVSTCGTGVTASVIAFALDLLGHKNYAIYDGSWTEYASKKTSIIKTTATKK